MNSKHIGDAHDHWKGSIIQRLKLGSALKNIAAVPMITDTGGWDREKLSTYSQLVNTDLVLKVEEFTRSKKDYFSNINHRGDLFLDPDTGVSGQSPKRTHVKPEEIKKLLGPQKGRRVIMVYQHAHRKKHDEQLNEIMNSVTNGGEHTIYGCSYWCGAVSMLFFSHKKGRIVKIKERLKKMFPYNAKNRVKMWPQRSNRPSNA